MNVMPGRFKPGDTVRIKGEPFVWVVEGARMRVSIATRRTRQRPLPGIVVKLVRDAGWAKIHTEVHESKVQEYSIA
ncbi:hypothetical protein SEA_SPEEDDEMON_980 [Gordonia phage SpeedDemon]|nr:hypothetical protein SEA_SPEEDDEMON_980 [Gordonia phage SpeedDemon]